MPLRGKAVLLIDRCQGDEPAPTEELPVSKKKEPAREKNSQRCEAGAGKR